MKYKINYSIGGSLQSNEEIIKKCSLNKIHYQRVKLSKCGADDNFLIGGGNLSKNERSHYVSLCSQLTSRIPDLDYPNITVEIMDYLWKDADDKIDSLGLDAEKTNALKQDVAEIRDNIDNDDDNFIGRINIASLQIIILFTLNEIPIDQPFNETDVNKIYPTYQALISMNWKDYKTVKRFITYDTNRLTNLYPKTGELTNLITILDYLTLNEIVSNFLENVNICGIASKSVWADGRYLNPILFLDHDLTHGKNYIGICYSQNGHDRDNLLSFYNFCKGTITDKKQLYSITFMMFLLIHEGWCDFFDKGMTKLSRNSFLDTPLLNITRFLDNYDLGLSIPKEFRKQDEEHKDDPRWNAQLPIIEYFDNVAIPNYLKAIGSWATSLSSDTSK